MTSLSGKGGYYFCDIINLSILTWILIYIAVFINFLLLYNHSIVLFCFSARCPLSSFYI